MPRLHLHLPACLPAACERGLGGLAKACQRLLTPARSTYREAKADLVPVETMAAEIMHQVGWAGLAGASWGGPALPHGHATLAGAFCQTLPRMLQACAPRTYSARTAPSVG